MKRVFATRLSVSLLAASGICLTGAAWAAPACPTSGNLGPCYTTLDAYVRQDWAGGNTSGLTAITPQAIATDLGVNAPSYLPTSAQYQVFYNYAAPTNRLLVFAPGKPDLPQHYEWFAVRAADRGYNVIVLHYWN